MILSSKYDHEISYWGDCCNTFDEEQKQYVYAECMGLHRNHYSFDAQDKSVLDIGGGPASLLLKTYNLKYGMVIDPLMMTYPEFVRERYKTKQIDAFAARGEDLLLPLMVDEVWIYNMLQHVDDPSLIINNAIRIGKRLRIFEWINIAPHEGHPHELSEIKLKEWIGLSGGKTRVFEGDRGCVGTAYFGDFIP